MRIALVHDQLLTLGGSERVFQYICESFPEATAFTLAYRPDLTVPYFKTRRVRTTLLNGVVRSMGTFRLAFPIATHVMERLDLRGFDVVLSSSATVAKYVRPMGSTHICYCYTPTRAIWQSESYFARGGVTASVFRALLPHFQRRDLAAARRIDHFVGISQMSARQIGEVYGRRASVLPCPIEVDRFRPSPIRGDHFLMVSRLERWKRLDYAIEACNRLGVPLRVVGDGEDAGRLRAMAGPTVTFLGSLNDAAVAREYSEARAVLFTPYLEYGLVPLEAAASGTPVIAFGEGGIRETMVGLDEHSGTQPTALFFYEQTADALTAAIRRFDPNRFPSDALVAHAHRFSVPEFRRRLVQLVESLAADPPA